MPPSLPTTVTTRTRCAHWFSAVEALPAQRRSVVISGAGDRRDEDIRAQTQILGKRLRRGAAVPGRLPARASRRRGNPVCCARVWKAQSARGRSRTSAANSSPSDRALDRLKPGDLCLVLVDQVDEALAHLAQKSRCSLTRSNALLQAAPPNGGPSPDGFFSARLGRIIRAHTPATRAERGATDEIRRPSRWRLPDLRRRVGCSAWRRVHRCGGRQPHESATPQRSRGFFATKVWLAVTDGRPRMRL